jgi:hypothetical protein
MTRLLTACAWLALALWLGGCSTVRGDFHQTLQVDALDARDRPVVGMQCQIGSGSSAKTFVTPADEVRVRRAMAPLEIECHRDTLVATATVKPRRERMEEALLPFGSVGVFVDHMSGSLYAYPTKLHLRVGQHLVLEHGGEAQIAQAEALAPGAKPEAVSGTSVVVASVQPTPGAAKAVAANGATAQGKPAAAAAKPARAAAKPVKAANVAASVAASGQPGKDSRATKTSAATKGTAASKGAAPAQVAATTKPKAAPSKAAVATTAAAAGTTAAIATPAATAASPIAIVPRAPANW